MENKKKIAVLGLLGAGLLTALAVGINGLQEKNPEAVSSAPMGESVSRESAGTARESGSVSGLSNDLTLEEAKAIIDSLRETGIEKGFSGAELRERLEYAARQMGTTLEELEALQTPSAGSAGSGSEKSGAGENGFSGKPGNDSAGGLSDKEQYDRLPNWLKENTVHPDDELTTEHTYYDSLEEIPKQYRDRAFYVEGKGWDFNPFS